MTQTWLYRAGLCALVLLPVAHLTSLGVMEMAGFVLLVASLGLFVNEVLADAPGILHNVIVIDNHSSSEKHQRNLAFDTVGRPGFGILPRFKVHMLRLSFVSTLSFLDFCFSDSPFGSTLLMISSIFCVEKTTAFDSGWLFIANLAGVRRAS